MQERNLTPGTWLLLIHHVPPEPLYLRAKVLRRIKQLGAIAIKNSAYLLPSTPEAMELLQWLRRDIAGAGGQAWIMEGRFHGGTNDNELVESFKSQRSADYGALLSECQELIPQLAEFTPAVQAKVARIEKRHAEIETIDFFNAPGKSEVRKMLDEIRRSRVAEGESAAQLPERGTWVTRSNVGVDRMASAWLIRRFIDPDARLRFVEDETVPPQPGEIRFDTFEGEFTHQDGLCTFEVLHRSMKRHNEGLRAIGEMIHDLDLLDDRYQRPETAGVGAALAGVMRRWRSDAERIHHAAAFFDILFAQFDSEEPSPSDSGISGRGDAMSPET